MLRNISYGNNIAQNVTLFLESMYSVEFLILGEEKKKQETEL